MYPIKKEIAGNELHGWMSDFTTPLLSQTKGTNPDDKKRLFMTISDTNRQSIGL